MKTKKIFYCILSVILLIFTISSIETVCKKDEGRRLTKQENRKKKSRESLDELAAFIPFS